MTTTMRFYPVYAALLAAALSVSFKADNWSLFAVDSRATVNMPGTPIENKLPPSNQNLKVHYVRTTAGLFVVARVDSDENYETQTPSTRQSYFDGLCTAKVIKTKAKLVARAAIKVDGYEGVDLVLKVADPTKPTGALTLLYSRALLVGKVNYQFEYCPHDSLGEKSRTERERFFNSVRIKPV